MHIVYSQERIPDIHPSIFLAGPTPRAAHVVSWRPAALTLLEQTGFAGVVLSPELRGTQPEGEFDYHEQIAWERQALLRASVVLFWVPRELQHMPAFTTNIEFGFVSERRQKLVLGCPPEAPKMRYLQWVARQQAAPVLDTLADTVAAAVSLVHIKTSIHDLLPNAAETFGPVAAVSSFSEVLSFMRQLQADDVECSRAAAYGMVAVAAGHAEQRGSGSEAVNDLSRAKCELDILAHHHPQVVAVTRDVLVAAQELAAADAESMKIFTAVLAAAKCAVGTTDQRG